MTAEERSIRNGGNGEQPKAGPTVTFVVQGEPALKDAAILYVKDEARLAEILSTLEYAADILEDESLVGTPQNLRDIAGSFRLAGKLAWGK